ncbi:hypothetical protein I6F30_25485 [Bradyrhizobium sp. NBAIM20]|uniref:hypothetical protein n=1 Tax=unclassified Bradyrhizobium TaxID=2631580 RepID=UPI001CD47A1A|nr:MULTISPECIES: hypothetical protein [unclassified Bradyrhizobium]MCA1414479.1 hypothetical protein [Bradyrhizobium sp. NBAIM20]MCA1459859.1 hypothetical protein [Bradyrhizobium sp. NBAIM18]
MSPLRFLTDAEADAILQAVKEDGCTLREITTNQRRPKLTSKEALGRRCTSHPEWGQEVMALLARNAETAKLRKLKAAGVLQKRAMTHCKRGHEFNETNTRYRPSTDGTGLFWRQCKICERDRQQNTAPLMKPEQLKRVKEALRRKIPSSQFAQGYAVGRPRDAKADKRLKLVDIVTYYRQRRLDPEFDQCVRESLEGEVERRARRRINKNSEEVYRQVRKILPSYIPDEIKYEIAGMVIEAWLQHRHRGKYFAKRDVPKVLKAFLADYNRMFPTKFRKFGDSLLVSLDEQVFDDGAATRGDSVSRGLWDD